MSQDYKPQYAEWWKASANAINQQIRVAERKNQTFLLQKLEDERKDLNQEWERFEKWKST